MDTEKDQNSLASPDPGASTAETKENHSQGTNLPKATGWRSHLGRRKAAPRPASSGSSTDGFEEVKNRPEKWSLGVLNDRETEEVPGQ